MLICIYIYICIYTYNILVYIYIYIHILNRLFRRDRWHLEKQTYPRVCVCVCVWVKRIVPPKKNKSWADRLSKHHIRGWRAVSAEGLQGKCSRKGSVFSHNHTRAHAHTRTCAQAHTRTRAHTRAHTLFTVEAVSPAAAMSDMVLSDCGGLEI